MPRKKAYAPQRMDRGNENKRFAYNYGYSYSYGGAEDWEEANDQNLWVLRLDVTAPLQTQGLTTIDGVYREPRRPPPHYQQAEKIVSINFIEIIDALINRGWSQHQIALECGVTQGSISSIKRGATKEPSYLLGRALIELAKRVKIPLTDRQHVEKAREAALTKAVETLREIATWFWSELEKEGFRCISLDPSNFKRRMVLSNDGNRAEVELSSSDYVNPLKGVKKLAQQLHQFFLEHPP